MSATKQETCEQRIADQLESRMQTFRAYETLLHDQGDGQGFEAAAEEVEVEVGDREADKIREDAQDRLYEWPLAISRHEVWKIELSWGGPQDYFEVHFDRENEAVTRITYHFLDWFDGASRALEGQDFATAEQIARNLCADFYVE